MASPRATALKQQKAQDELRERLARIEQQLALLVELLTAAGNLSPGPSEVPEAEAPEASPRKGK